MKRPSSPGLVRRALFLVCALSACAAAAAEFPQGLLFHFGFDEYVGSGTVPDKTGRGHSGRAQGTKWTSAGKLGGALDFGPTNGHVTVASAPTLAVTQATLAAWFRTSVPGTTARGLIERTPAAGFGLGLAAGGKVRFVMGSNACASDAAATDGQWHHAAATYDGYTMKLYVDGQLQKQTLGRTGQFGGAGEDLIIGQHRAGGAKDASRHSFDGTIDEVMLFNHAITADEVAAVIAAAKPKFSKQQVRQRLAELQDLLDRGLILQEFYDRKVKECEVAAGDEPKK